MKRAVAVVAAACVAGGVCVATARAADRVGKGADVVSSVAAAMRGFSLSSAPGDMNLEADKLDYDYKSGRLHCTGNVVVRQAGTILKADVLTILTPPAGRHGAPSVVTAQGNVSVSNGANSAFGEKAVYDRDAGTIKLTGNAKLGSEGHSLTGDSVVFYLNEGRAFVDGGSQRVRAVIQSDALDAGQDEESLDESEPQTPTETPASERMRITLPAAPAAEHPQAAQQAPAAEAAPADTKPATPAQQPPAAGQAPAAQSPPAAEAAPADTKSAPPAQQPPAAGQAPAAQSPPATEAAPADTKPATPAQQPPATGHTPAAQSPPAAEAAPADTEPATPAQQPPATPPATATPSMPEQAPAAPAAKSAAPQQPAASPENGAKQTGTEVPGQPTETKP